MIGHTCFFKYRERPKRDGRSGPIWPDTMFRSPPCVNFENESRPADEITLLRVIGAPLTAARAVQPVRISCLWIFLDLPMHAFRAYVAFQLFESIMGKFELGPASRRYPNLTWSYTQQIAPPAEIRLRELEVCQRVKPMCVETS